MDTPDNYVSEISSMLPPLKLTAVNGCRVRIPMDRLVMWRDATEAEAGQSVVIYTGLADEHLKEHVKDDLGDIDYQYENA